MVHFICLPCPHLLLLRHLPYNFGIRVLYLRPQVRTVHFLRILLEIGEDLGDGAIAAGGAGIVLGGYVGFERYGQLQVVDSECAGIEDVELSGVPWPASRWLECV